MRLVNVDNSGGKEGREGGEGEGEGREKGRGEKKRQK